jgi:hypothetical protein
MLDAALRGSQSLCAWPAGEASEACSESSQDSSYASGASLQRMLDQFPDPPSNLSPKIASPAAEDDLYGLWTWERANKTHLSGSTAFDIGCNSLEPSREVLLSPREVDEFNKATNNIAVYNKQTTNRNSGALRTFFDDASIASPTLFANRWSVPAAVAATTKRHSAMHRIRLAARRSANNVNCFCSSVEDDEDANGRKESTSTVSTIVSSIAEITDTVSQMKWTVYFAKMEERRRVRDAKFCLGYQV